MTLRLNNQQNNSASIDYADQVGGADSTITIPQVNDATFIVSDTNGDVEIGGGDIQLNADGSAEFAGDVTVGNYSAFSFTPTGEGAGIFDDGIIELVRFNGGAVGQVFRVFNTTGTDIAPATVPTVLINNNGNATFAGTVTENGSDIKFKTQTRSVPTSQLEDVKNLQLKEWNWTEDAPGNTDRNERRNRGLIAQEAELVDPKLVYDVYQDEDNSYKAIDHQVLIFKLLGAIQELEAEVQELKGGAS